MRSPWISMCLVAGLVFVSTKEVPRQDPAKPVQEAKKTDQSLADQIAALTKEHQEREKKFYEDLGAAKDDKKISDLNREYMDFRRKEAATLEALIKKHGKDPAVFEGILVLIGQFGWILDDDLVELVLQHHLANPKMGQLCFDIMWRPREEWAEKLLHETADKHPERAVRGQAAYALGVNFKYRAQPRGDKKLSEAEEALELAEATRYFTEVTKSFADVTLPNGRGKLGEKATVELTRIKNLPFLRVGKTAPEIVGEDIEGNKFTLSDYRGKVVVIDFWGHW